MPDAPASNQATPPSLAPRLLSALFLAALGVLLFHFYGNATRGYLDTPSVLVWWTRQWFNPASELEHAPLLVLVSAYLLWRNLKSKKAEGGTLKAEIGDINSTTRRFSFSAFSLLPSALLLHTLGFATQQPRLSLLALLLYVYGLFTYIGGPRWRLASAFPLALLVLAFPWSFLDEAGFWLRLAVVTFAEKSAHLLGHDVIRSGTQLLAPDGRYSYDVAAACSGVRSLIAMIALALVIGYLRLPTWPRRLALLALTPVYILLGNFLRIAAIIATGAFFGQRAGELTHDISGYAIFLLLFALLSSTASRLRPIARCSMPDARLPDSEKSPPSRPAPIAFRLLPLALCALLSAAHLSLAHHLATRPPSPDTALRLAPNTRDPAELPFLLGTRWIGQPIDVTAAEREILPPDTGFSHKLYASTSAPREEVLLSLILSGRDRSSIHRPELCLLGQGWTTLATRTHTFQLPTGALTATLLTLEQKLPPNSAPSAPITHNPSPITAPAKRALLAYWFINSTTQTPSHRAMLLRDALDRLRLRSDRWAYLVALTPLAPDEPASLERLQQILSLAWPQICTTPATNSASSSTPDSATQSPAKPKD